MWDDPFFNPYRNHMRGVDTFYHDIFRVLHPSSQYAAIDSGRDSRRDGGRQIAQYDDGSRRPHEDYGMGHPGTMFENELGNLMQMMTNTRLQDDPHASFYSQTAVMSYSNLGQGPPKIFQAATATRQAPGGMRETRKALRDSESGMEKMEYGRRIGERGHVMSRSRNIRTGDQEENQDYLNLDEEEAPTFESEWRQKTQPYKSAYGFTNVDDVRRNSGGSPAVGNSSSRVAPRSHLAITEGPFGRVPPPLPTAERSHFVDDYRDDDNYSYDDEKKRKSKSKSKKGKMR